MFSAGLMLGFALSALVTLKIIDWMVYFVIIIGIAFLDILIIFFYLKKDIGVYYMYENNYPKSKIKQVLTHYLSEEASVEKMNDAAETYMSDQSLLGFGLGSQISGVVEKADLVKDKNEKPFFIKYYHEIAYGFRQSVIINLSLFNIMLIFLIFFITKNIDDGEETALSNVSLTIAGGCELFFKILSSCYQWNRKRKSSITTGMVLLSLLTGLIALLQSYDYWFLLKLMPLFIYSIIGIFISTPNFASFPELYPSPVIGIVYGFQVSIMSALDFLFPLLDVKAGQNKNISQFTLIFAGIMLLGALLNHKFTFECGGMTRSQSKKKMKGK